MTGDQKRVLAVVAGLVAVVLVGVLLVATRGDDPKQVETTAGETTSSEESADDDEADVQLDTTETTLRLEPVTPGPSTAPPPTQRPATAPKPSSAPPTAPVAAMQPSSGSVVTGDGALMARPTTATTRTLDAKRCPTAHQGWTSRDCGAVRATDLVLVWSIESKGSGLRAVLLRQSAGGQWTTVLAAEDPDGSRWSSIKVAADDVSGDGNPEIGFGFHLKGPQQALAVDLVEAPGRVVVHVDLPKGAAKVDPGRLDTWSAGAAGDQTVTHSVIQVADGAYRRTSTMEERRAELPPSEL